MYSNEGWILIIYKRNKLDQKNALRFWLYFCKLRTQPGCLGTAWYFQWRFPVRARLNILQFKEATCYSARSMDFGIKQAWVWNFSSTRISPMLFYVSPSKWGSHLNFSLILFSSSGAKFSFYQVLTDITLAYELSDVTYKKIFNL